jgi:hypothetical protein
MLYAVGVLACAVATQGLDGFAQSLVTEVPPANWPTVLSQLKTLRPDKAPYRLTHRCRAYDEEVLIQTPMVRAAAFVQLSKKEGKAVTPEQLASVFDPHRLIIELHTYHRNVEKAGAVEISLKVDGKPVHPLQSMLLTTQLKSVGFYAEPFYYGTKQFVFDMAECKGAKSLTVVIVESENKGAEIHEMQVDLAKLQ